MVTIGGQPILWHIMNIYASYGFNDFVLPLGYKGDVIKDYFLRYNALASDFSVDLANGSIEYLRTDKRNWKVTLVDTGINTLTGGRLNRLASHLKGHGTFMLTYGDGVADVNLKKLVELHRSHGKIATVTAVRPPARFGEMVIEAGRVTEFKEKPQTAQGWINGGYFVFEPKIFDYLDKGDETILEQSPLETLARTGQLHASNHEGFWQCMDTMRDKSYLDALWETNEAPWKCWSN
jgi:glucose-1-phosphate cytidylyltransferase